MICAVSIDRKLTCRWRTLPVDALFYAVVTTFLTSSSGDTPVITKGDISSKEAAEHQEALSSLWAHVYALRANILRVERLKVWPDDPSEPITSEQVLAEAIEARDYEIASVKLLIARYIDHYGQYISHGEAEFNAEALLRLAGWEQDF